jgi:Kinesin motor domain
LRTWFVDMESHRTRVQVHARLRPVELATAPHEGRSTGIVSAQGPLVTLTDAVRGAASEFVLDGCFGVEASQENVFASIGQPLVAHCLAGYSACCFAYGQTGSGKTYTMYGEVHLQSMWWPLLCALHGGARLTPFCQSQLSARRVAPRARPED